MIVFALLVSLLRFLLSSGAPISTNSDTTMSARDENTPPLTADRSTLEIIWTCAAIIFASSWVCVHPHIPGYKSTRSQRWGIRLRLFVNALLFPDQFVGRAYYEWEGSKALHAEMLKKLGKIQLERPVSQPAVQGDDAGDMIKALGGEAKAFGEKVGEARETGKLEDEILALRSTRRNLDARWTRVQRLMARQLGEVEVEDQPIFPQISKNDWTMVHAHYIHMGGVVFQGPDNKMWFKDFRDWTPADVEAFFALKLSKEEIQDCSKADGLAKAFVIIQCLWFVVQCIGRAAYGLLLIQLEVTCLAYIACNIGMYMFWWYKPLNVSCPERIQSAEVQPENAADTAVKFPWHQAIFETLVTGDIGLLVFPSRGWDNGIVDPKDLRFPVNYYYKHKTWGRYVEPLGQTVPLAIFGAIHAIAWHGSFPTLAEKLLWRSASIAPAILALILLAYFVASENASRVPTWAAKSLECVACFTILLRDLPPLAFQTVEWSDILPHV